MDAENFKICAQVKNLERWVNWGKNQESWITFFVVGGEKIIASQIFYFPKTYFPDFTSDNFDEAVLEYTRRDRRFGGIKK